MYDSNGSDFSGEKNKEIQNMKKKDNSFIGVNKTFFHEDHDGIEVYIRMENDYVYGEVYVRDKLVEEDKKELRHLQFNGDDIRLIRTKIYHWESSEKDLVSFDIYYPYGFPIVSKEFHFKKKIEDVLWQMRITEFLDYPPYMEFRDREDTHTTVFTSSSTRKDLQKDSFFEKDPRWKTKEYQTVEDVLLKFDPFQVLLKRKMGEKGHE